MLKWLTPQFALFVGLATLSFTVIAITAEVLAIGELWAFAAGAIFSLAVEPLRDKLREIEQMERGEQA